MDTIIDHMSRALSFEKQGNFAEALKEYNFILKQDSAYRDVYVNLGSLYSRLNRLNDALEAYERALHLKSDYITFFNIGSIYYRKKEFKKAIIYLEKSKRLNSRFVLSIQVMGLCYSRLNNLKAAETNFHEVLNIWPENRVALTALAIMFYNQNRDDEAMDMLNRLVVVDSDNGRVRKLIYSLHRRNGRIDESVKELKRIRRISDGFRMFDEYIASVPVAVYTDRYGTLDEKINMLEEAEKDSDNLISLSLCHLFKGETDRALDCLFEARKISLN